MLDRLFSDLPADRLPMMDHIAAVALKHFRVPIAVVSSNAGEEVAFIGSHGLPDNYVPKDTTFCRLVAAGSEVVVVEDALKDERLWSNPAVLGPPKIRFFAGAPLMTESGQKLGTICIADVVPRELAFGQRVTLKHIARIATQEWVDSRSRAASAFAFDL